MVLKSKLRRRPGDFEEEKKWKETEEIERQEEVEGKLTTIQEENENDSGAMFSEME